METETFGKRAATAVKRFVLTLLVLGLTGAVLVLLSQLNARTYRLEVRDGKLVVMKGRYFPTGSEPFRPSDPALADAYAPLELEGLNPLQIANRTYSDRDELDRALFDVIEVLAKPRVASDDPALLEKGLYYVRRAERLSGLTDEQRLSLKSMKGEVAFYQARGKLDEARKLLGEAMAQLRLAGHGDSRHVRAANQMISAIEAPANALEEALRKAVHSLSSPPEPQPAAPSQPTEPPPPKPTDGGAP